MTQKLNMKYKTAQAVKLRQAIAKKVDKSYYDEIKNSQATQKKKSVTKSNTTNQNADYVCTAKGAVYDKEGIADYSSDADLLKVRSRKSGEEIEFAASDLPIDFKEISIYEIWLAIKIVGICSVTSPLTSILKPIIRQTPKWYKRGKR